MADPTPLIDWGIRLGDLLQLVAIIGGGLAVFFSMQSNISVLRNDVKYIEKRLGSLSEAFTQLGTILTQVAVQDMRLSMMEKNIDEMRHGEGYVRATKADRVQSKSTV